MTKSFLTKYFINNSSFLCNYILLLLGEGRRLILKVNHQLDQVTGAKGALGVGLSNGSPDISVTAGFNRQF